MDIFWSPAGIFSPVTPPRSENVTGRDSKPKTPWSSWCLRAFVVKPSRSSVSRPDLRLGVGSRISWVIYLSRIRDPTQPLVFPPSRDCRGSFSPYSEKGSPSPAGILFSFPAGIFFPAAPPPSIRCPDRIFEPPTSCTSWCLRAFDVNSGSRRPAPCTIAANARTKTLTPKPLFPFSHKNSDLPRSVFMESGIDGRQREWAAASILNLSPGQGRQRIAQGVQTLGKPGRRRISEAPAGATLL